MMPKKIDLPYFELKAEKKIVSSGDAPDDLEVAMPPTINSQKLIDKYNNLSNGLFGKNQSYMHGAHR